MNNYDSFNSDESLTQLGKQLVDLPIEPRLGKSILAAIALRCLDPVLTIVCALSYRDPFIIPTTDRERINLRELKRGFFSLDCDSDHVTLVKAYREWQSNNQDQFGGHSRSNQYSQRQKEPKDYLSFPTMAYIKNLRHQLLGQLRSAGFIKMKGNNWNSINEININSDKWSVVKV
jgi:HrpA-like RNA helicase